MIIKDIWKHQLVYPLSKFLWFSYIVPFSEIGIRSLALRLVCFWWHLFARCFLQHVRCEAGNPVFKNMCTMYITMQCPKRFSNQHVFQKGRIPFANLPLTPPPQKKKLAVWHPTCGFHRRYRMRLKRSNHCCHWVTFGNTSCFQSQKIFHHCGGVALLGGGSNPEISWEIIDFTEEMHLEIHPPRRVHRRHRSIMWVFPVA